MSSKRLWTWKRCWKFQWVRLWKTTHNHRVHNPIPCSPSNFFVTMALIYSLAPSLGFFLILTFIAATSFSHIYIIIISQGMTKLIPIKMLLKLQNSKQLLQHVPQFQATGSLFILSTRLEESKSKWWVFSSWHWFSTWDTLLQILGQLGTEYRFFSPLCADLFLRKFWTKYNHFYSAGRAFPCKI